MSELVRPVLERLFQQYLTVPQNTDITEPVYLQITKYRADPQSLKVRLSDGQYTVAALTAGVIDQSFGENLRLVKLTKFQLGLTGPTGSRLYLKLNEWKDVGPCSVVIGDPKAITPDAVLKPAVPPTACTSGILTSTGTGALNANPPPAVQAESLHIAPQTTSTQPNTNRQISSIESISPMISKWTILGRASHKSSIREFNRATSNGNGEKTVEKGQLFSVTFTDQTSDIKATAFGDEVTNFYNKIVDGQQYYISGMNVRKANPKFNNTSHENELMFRNDTEIVPATDIPATLPTIFFKFVPSIKDIADLPTDNNIDVAGVAIEIGDMQSITSKSTNIPYTKRDITLADDSGSKISLTLWGVEAEQFNAPVGSVVAVKGARISDFRGKSLSATRNAQVVIDPDEKTVHRLKGWWNATKGSDLDFKIVSDEKKAVNAPRMSISRVISENHGMSSASALFELKARVATIYQRNVAYPSCTNAGCRKKVTDNGMSWRCEKCELDIPEPKYRYMLTLVLSDATCEGLGLQVSVFDEVGHALYGDKAKEFQMLADNFDGAGYNQPLATELRAIQGNEYIWRIRGSLDTYRGQERARYTADSATPPDPVAEGTLMLAEMGF